MKCLLAGLLTGCRDRLGLTLWGPDSEAAVRVRVGEGAGLPLPTDTLLVFRKLKISRSELHFTRCVMDCLCAGDQQLTKAISRAAIATEYKDLGPLTVVQG